ncbi:helix-turn-helix domain-containing protein [Streptomyces halstedii]
MTCVAQAAVRQAVLDHRPCDVGLSGQLWTRRLVGELIAKLYRVRLTEPGVGKYLRRWGLSFQRPDKRAVEQDPEAVRRWHQETWPEMKRRESKDLPPGRLAAGLAVRHGRALRPQAGLLVDRIQGPHQ